jgi:hypothetical protein
VSVVIDSSIALSWYFEDEVTAESQAVLDEVGERGAIVPALWRFEVANGLQMALRRNRIDAQLRDDALVDLAALDIVIDPECVTYA